MNDKPKANRKPTPHQDCEALSAGLEPQASLAARIIDACGEYLHGELGHYGKKLRDGGAVCLHCGFVSPSAMDTCPNCGTHLQYDNKHLNLNKRNINWISVLETADGVHGQWLVQRQFLVDSGITSQYNGPRTFTSNILEVYRNFFSEDGTKVVSFRRALNMFAGWSARRYRESSPIKYCRKSMYDKNYLTPQWCEVAWDAVVNGEQEAELDRRIAIQKTILSTL